MVELKSCQQTLKNGVKLITMNDSVSPHSYQHLVLTLFFNYSDKFVLRSHGHFNLYFNNGTYVEHICMCLLVICNYFLLKYLSMSFAHSLIGLFGHVSFNLFKVYKKAQDTFAEPNTNNERIRNPFATISQF